MRTFRNGSPARRALAVAAALALTLAATVAALAPAAEAREPGPAAGDPAVETLRGGERLAEAVAIATGVPISPLLGVSALGAWHWWRAAPAERPALPWYARPLFWGTGLALALLFAINGTIGAAVPGLEKPMQVVEQFENQVSGLVASPIVVLEIFRLLGGPLRAAALGASPAAEAGAAAVGGLPPFLAPVVAIGAGALALTAYALVFLAFHAVQVLITLSPSALLDLLLRAFRLGMLALAGMAASVHPYLGAIYGLLLLAVAAMVAGWAFRLMVFGTVCGRDLLGGTRGDGKLVAFAAKGLEGPPLRAWGRIEPAPDGGWRFRWRPWLVLPARSVPLGPGAGLAILRGTLSPRAVRTGPLREASLLRFPPRFRGREAELAERLGGAAVLEGRIVRGLRASWAWLREWITGVEPGVRSLPSRP